MELIEIIYIHIVAILKFWFWEKKIFADFFGGPLEYQKNYKFSRNIERTPYRRVAQKKVQFCTRRRKSHFFRLTLYMCTKWFGKEGKKSKITGYHECRKKDRIKLEKSSLKSHPLWVTLYPIEMYLTRKSTKNNDYCFLKEI